MTSTAKLSLPLLQPSQAQKHVTVNEAISRIDALAALTLLSCSQPAPPSVAAEGAAYGVPVGASGDWAGKAGTVALFLNGGWDFVTPERGWRAWIADEHAQAIHDGTGWRAGALALAPSGAGSFLKIREFDHAVTAGLTSSTAVSIPAPVMVFAVTARVIVALTGTLTSWRLGSAAATDRYGTGLGTAAGSYAHGLLATPMTHYADEPLLLGAEGGSFSGGTVRIAIHYFEPALPGL
jgi:hypothetical protein